MYFFQKIRNKSQTSDESNVLQSIPLTSEIILIKNKFSRVSRLCYTLFSSKYEEFMNSRKKNQNDEELTKKKKKKKKKNSESDDEDEDEEEEEEEEKKKEEIKK